MVNDMPKHEPITLELENSKGRKVIRTSLINEFLKEEPGNGTGDLASKYIYYVEELNSGKKIYLTRPAGRNNGMDFIINVQEEFFLSRSGKRRLKSPAHHNIETDLKKKKLESPKNYKKLYDLICKVYNCETIEFTSLPEFKEGYDVELILKVLKWLFIEQDVTYWNNSGRKMLMNSLPKP